MPAGVSPRMEDYLETILALLEEKPVARVTEIAEALNVSKPTVTSALRTLAEGKFVEHQTYGYIELTEKGRKAAERVDQRHRLLRRFFEHLLGVSPETAVEDACRAEHYVSRDTLERLTRFIEFIENCPRTGPDWLEHFHCFCKDGGRGSAEGGGCGPECIEKCMQELKASGGAICGPK